jgi:hypothetical protein
MMRLAIAALALIAVSQVQAQHKIPGDKFKQFKEEWATPNNYRTASGAPGHEYYQQRADYDMQILLNDQEQKITGSQTVTYYNNSPDQLEYLWLQLDQNMRAKGSLTELSQTGTIEPKMRFEDIQRYLSSFDGGFRIGKVTDAAGKDLPYTINYTMMRIDLPAPLKPGARITFNITWWYPINDRMKVGGRSGYEYFADDDNYLYTIAQFYPRMAVYNDVEGWQHKQFLGRGEFALVFGNYKVAITVPSDHVVASTGVLQNATTVLSAQQRERLKQAETSTQPVMIVTPAEALENEKKRDKAMKTWVFAAENVRDFAFASSRKFIWDAMGLKFGTRTVMAMSFYPKEGNPLWERYSTKVVAHTLRTYSKFTFDYPYPVAISVHSKDIGMEYPMICFNGGRPEPDGTYSERTKYGMLSVIIHEVGHNFFPMIVNSDERQWTWMDEGLNTFLEYLTEQEWERGYPSHRGPAYKIVDYMGGDKSNIRPIMTNSESIFQFGNNAYGKPATALNILRETVMGRELFDHAFKTYARRWMFRHPSPEDFFRTMEDASGVDLDWFWRGWFYTTDHCDMAIADFKYFLLDTQDPEVEKARAKAEAESSQEKRFIGDERNKTDIPKTQNELDPSLNDFYNNYDPYKVTIMDMEQYKRYLAGLNEEDKALLKAGYHFYQMDIENVGGLVMPVILEFVFEDGMRETARIPAEIWRQNNWNVSKVFVFKKPVASVLMDPFLETADCDLSNNAWPRKHTPNRFELFRMQNTDRYGRPKEMNPMQREKEMEKRD